MLPLLTRHPPLPYPVTVPQRRLALDAEPAAAAATPAATTSRVKRLRVVQLQLSFPPEGSLAAPGALAAVFGVLFSTCFSLRRGVFRFRPRFSFTPTLPVVPAPGRRGRGRPPPRGRGMGCPAAEPPSAGRSGRDGKGVIAASLPAAADHAAVTGASALTARASRFARASRSPHPTLPRRSTLFVASRLAAWTPTAPTPPGA